MNAKPRKRVLLVTYSFPPTGNVGVLRPTKFVKYLPAHGWDVSVLTVSNPSVPLQDQTLLAEIPPETLVRKTRTLEPGYAMKSVVSATQGQNSQQTRSIKRAIKHAIRSLGNTILQPDAQILWKGSAVREGRRLLAEIPHDAIMVSAPPFSSFLIGETLSRQFGLPLILDYRDEWAISNAYWENKKQGSLISWLQTKMEQSVVRAASVLLATTESSAAALTAVADEMKSSAISAHIYNGYDQADFENRATAAARSNDHYRLTYTGTLWNLTTVEPLVSAVERLSRESPRLAERLELVFAGRRTEPQEHILKRLESLPCQLVLKDYMDHQAAIDLMCDSDGLCLLLADVPHAERVVPSKVFEYMAAKRRIISISPDGEVTRLLNDCPLAQVCQPSDIALSRGA